MSILSVYTHLRSNFSKIIETWKNQWNVHIRSNHFKDVRKEQLMTWHIQNIWWYCGNVLTSSAVSYFLMWHLGLKLSSWCESESSTELWPWCSVKQLMLHIPGGKHFFLNYTHTHTHSGRKQYELSVLLCCSSSVSSHSAGSEIWSGLLGP